MKFYTHKTTSIFVIEVKFHTNPLFRLRDVQFFQTAVTHTHTTVCVCVCVTNLVLQCFDAVGWAAGRASGL